MDLLFLGSGNAFASGRYWASFLLDGRYLFEASPVALPHLKQCDVAPNDIEAVFISHFHGDHYFGLPFLLLEYAEMEPRTKDLTILGPPGVEERIRTVTEAAYPHLLTKERSYGLSYVDLRDGLEGEAVGLKFLARSVPHVDELECFGLRVELGGRVLAYSGDAIMSDTLVELADGADIFVVECTTWNGSLRVHVGPTEVRELRRRLGPKPVFILTHLDAGQEDLDIENTLLAEDLKRFTL